MPIVSVIVPTHNRAKYAKHCIGAVLAVTSDDLQLVMTDTSTDLDLYDWLHAEGVRFLDDPRFIYKKIDGPSDVTKNHNDAFALASGEYVGVIGDDDCITAALPEAMRWAAANRVPAITQTLPAIYVWPDFRSSRGRGGHAGRLYIPRRQGGLRWRDAERDLLASLDRGFQGTDELPRTYHGFVQRQLLEGARERSGAYVHGSSPDMSGSVAVAGQISRYCEVDLPLTIPGISGGSNSGRSAVNTHKGDLASDTQTRKFVDGGWAQGLPRFFSVETVWAHAGIETLRHVRPEFLSRFNYARLLAVCTLRHPDFLAEIAVATREAEEMLGRDLSEDIAREKRKERWARARYLLRRAMNPTAANGRRYFSKLETVDLASTRYAEYSSSQGFDFACLAGSSGLSGGS